MYRTATASLFDVLDTIHVNLVIMEYPETPGTVPPERIVFSTSVPGVGEPDTARWARRALEQLLAELP